MPKCDFCACCRTATWNAWAGRSRFASTCGWWPPHIATWRRWCAKVRFARILWYRIAVFPILLPPLRDRVGDIPSLAKHFAQRAAIRFGLAPVLPSDADIELLQGYDWPGNIRELGAVIDRAAILGDGRSLELAAALGVSGPILRRVEPPSIGIAINGDPRPSARSQRLTTRCGPTSNRRCGSHAVALKARAALPDTWRSIRTRCVLGCES